MGKSIFPLYVCDLPFLQYWARLPSMVLDPSILSKGVETSPTATHFSPAYAQTMHFLPDFNHIPMAGRATTRKLWQTDIIKVTQEILDKINKRERQEVPLNTKSNRNEWGNNNNGFL